MIQKTLSRICFVTILASVLAACSSAYQIAGKSDINSLDGKKLYLARGFSLGRAWFVLYGRSFRLYYDGIHLHGRRKHYANNPGKRYHSGFYQYW